MNRQTFVAGIHELPIRKANGVTVAELHAQAALAALADAGLGLDDVDGYFCGADAPGMGVATMSEYLGLSGLRHVDSTETGGSSYLLQVHHAAEAIAAGHCDIALITMADTPLSANGGLMLSGVDRSRLPSLPYTVAIPPLPIYGYGMVAQRHMHEFGTTSEQLAWVKVAASHHAQHNPNAKLPEVVTIDDVIESPMVADPLHRLDCCVITDGGGAIVLAREEVARSLSRPLVRVAGMGEAVKHSNGGYFEITSSAGAQSGRSAFAQAGITPADVHYASLYDSFTITVIVQLEDLGFCPPGMGGQFAADGNLISGVGRLAVNTDGGGLCNNHPGNKGGIPKLVEAVRQCRGEAHPSVQVPDHEFVLAHGTGAMMSSYHVAGTTILQAA